MINSKRLPATALVLALALSACASRSERKESDAAGEVAAQEEAEKKDDVNAFEACREPANRKEILLDKTRRRMHQTVCGAALWFDGLFGERNLDAARTSHGRIEISNAHSDFEGNDTRVRFHARAQLPALERRLSAFVGRDDEDDFVRDRSEGAALRSQTRRLTDRDTFLAGLGFVAASTDRFQSDFRIGVRSLRLPKIFVQNRLSYVPYSDPVYRVSLRTTPFWNNRDGFGLTSSADWDRALEKTFLLRWGSIATISEKSAGLDWRSALILYQNLKGQSALAYEAFIRGASGAAEPLGEYGVRTIGRKPILDDRLFVEVILGYSWPREDPFLERDGSAAASVGVEMPFGVQPN